MLLNFQIKIAKKVTIFGFIGKTKFTCISVLAIENIEFIEIICN